MPKDNAYGVDLDYLAGFDDKAVSAREMALICSILPQLMVELVAVTDQDGKERHGSRTLRTGIDNPAS